MIGVSIVAGIPDKYTNAQDNESTSFLPGDAESTKALTAAEELQQGELAPAVIVYRRESGLTAADKAKIDADVKAMSARRFDAVVADGATAAAGGQGARRRRRRRWTGAAVRRRRSPASRATSRRSSDRSAREDGKAALVFAYLKGDGSAIDAILDPVNFWRETVSNPGGGLEVKVTGAAGYAADAIEVFEGINGTLVGAATLLVIVLLILIYRSPVFLFIPWPRCCSRRCSRRRSAMRCRRWG